MQHNEQSKLVLGGEGDKTKVRYANFDEEMIGMTTTVTNEDAAGAFGSQVSWSRLTISGHNLATLLYFDWQQLVGLLSLLTVDSLISEGTPPQREQRKQRATMSRHTGGARWSNSTSTVSAQNFKTRSPNLFSIR